MSLRLSDLSSLTTVAQMPSIPDDIAPSNNPCLKKLAIYTKHLYIFDTLNRIPHNLGAFVPDYPWPNSYHSTVSLSLNNAECSHNFCHLIKLSVSLIYICSMHLMGYHSILGPFSPIALA